MLADRLHSWSPATFGAEMGHELPRPSSDGVMTNNRKPTSEKTRKPLTMFLYCKETAVLRQMFVCEKHTRGCEDYADQLSFVIQAAIRVSPCSAHASRQKARRIWTFDGVRNESRFTLFC